MIHELRIYFTVPAKPPAGPAEPVQHGHAEAVGQVTASAQAGFWTTLVGPSNHALYYLVEWESLAEREDKWNRFAVDPDWVAARTASEADGPILERVENMFLQPTAFSAVK